MNHSESIRPASCRPPSPVRPRALAIAIALALGSGAAQAATITVDSSADGALGTFPDACTLRAAIEAANTGAPVDGCTTGSLGADAIEFDPGLAQATITLAAGQLGIFDELTITGPVADDAGGIVVDGNAQSRILFMEGATASEFAIGLTGMTLTNGFESGSEGGAVNVNSADLELHHVTVSDSATVSSSYGGLIVLNGNLSLSNSTVTGNSTDRNVGGLGIRNGDLTLISSMISDNSAGSNLGGADACGDVNLYMIDSTVSGNSARFSAGGLRVAGPGLSCSDYVPGSTTTIIDSTISNNTTVDGNGGGLNLSATDVEMTNVVVTGNSVTGLNDRGGGVVLTQGNMVLTNVTITGNSAVRAGGGLVVGNDGVSANLILNDSRIINNVVTGDSGADVDGGAGIRVAGGETTINSSTISGNSSESTGFGVKGGGIFIYDATVSLNNSTVSGNSTRGSSVSGGGIYLRDDSDVSLVHTTVANNTAASGADGIHVSQSQFSLDNSLIVQSEAGQTACNAQATSHSSTLATDSSCTGTGTALADIALQPLADNGGATLTHALGPTSVAMEAAGDCVADFGIDTDQRGFPRPGIDSSACDIGAFEFQNVFSVSGTVSGLAGTGLVLQNNGEDDLAIDSDGSFTFANTLTNGSNYNVEVTEYPLDPLQSCWVANGNGTINGADVTDVTVECEAGFRVGGSVTGLELPGLVLGLDDVPLLLLDVDNDYVLPAVLPDGAEYQVTVELVPNAHDCQIANATGTIAGADVFDADVACTTDIEFADGFELLQPEPVELNE